MGKKINLDALSDDAKAVAAAWFSMLGSKSELVFHMKDSRPSQRSAKALAELVGKGVVSVEYKINGYGGMRYRALIDCRPALKWAMELEGDAKAAVSWPLVEPIGKAKA